MSRSYKKSPVIKENRRGSNKKAKRIANSSLRMKTKDGIEIGQNSDYKKHFDSWNISDYKFVLTEEEAIAKYRELTDTTSANYDSWFAEQYPTEQIYLRWWRKHYKNK